LNKLSSAQLRLAAFLTLLITSIGVVDLIPKTVSDVCLCIV